MRNSLNIEMLEVPSGSFLMGAVPDDSDALWDEIPQHKVTITYPFLISATEISNQQYEQFDPSHKSRRGDGKGVGFSLGDDEPVVNVSRKDAIAFCEWLSKKEGKLYRLPTEAEWEYCCRAGTNFKYYTGASLPQEFLKDQRLVKKWDAKAFYKNFSLETGKTIPNSFGLYDMHGNVEEWCLDRFAYYTKLDEIDPLNEIPSQADGHAYVTRGGSFGVKPEHLRSSRRLGMLEDDKNWLVGFRIVCAPMPEPSKQKNTREPLNSLVFSNVNQERCDWKSQIASLELENTPVYLKPLPYLVPSRDVDKVPLHPHNHCPAITWCDNGDILAIWFSTNGEHDRDMIILGSRLRKGADCWDPASLFFRVPGRNTTGSSLFTKSDGTILHLNGLEVASSWKTLAMVIRESKDHGATWSSPRFVDANHRWRNQVIAGTFETSKGELIQLCDAVPHGLGGSAFWKSSDGGLTWRDLARDESGKLKKNPWFFKGWKGAWIAGIHAGAVELKDGRFMAFGRANNIRGKMPMSISEDGGYTWKYLPTEFPTITYGQRLVLKRLREGPILFVSFTDRVKISGNNMYKFMKGMELKTLSGEMKRCYGLFAAVSFDEGKTFPVRRFLDCSGGSKEPRYEKGFGIRRPILIDETHGELKGYLAGTQSPDGMIHIVSSRMHYRFNLKWLI